MSDFPGTSTLPLTPEGLPDWTAIDFDVHCSRCGYNLRTLTTPRCTECGFQFEWDELIQGLFNRNPELFEHTWREKPVRAYLRTIFAPMFRPKKFWQGVSLHDRIETKPLVFLLGSSVLALLVVVQGLALLFSLLIYLIFQFGLLQRQGYYGYYPYSGSVELSFVLEKLEEIYLAFGIEVYQDFEDWIVIPFMIRVGFGSILLMLLNLHETIARFKLRRGHMLRVLAYASGAGAVLGAMFVLVLPVAQVLIMSFWPKWFAPATIMLIVFTFAPFLVQFRSGLRNYLKIRHATLAAVLLLIVGLLAPVVALAVTVTVLHSIF
ncbi:MAG TPA: hypothetical protein VNT79_11600 [Phycisphaerae bacterium]|nr:hypothetical protein [Phycisphaerae bacterium]